MIFSKMSDQMQVVIEVFLWIVGQAVVAAAIWGAIRADIKGMHQRLDDLKKSVDQAHNRIDNHLDAHRERSMG